MQPEHDVNSHKQNIPAKPLKIVTTNNTSQYPQGLSNRLPYFASSHPGHVPSIILPLPRKARDTISETHWISGTVSTIISLPLQPIIIILQRKARDAISEVHCIYGGCLHQEITSQGSPANPYSSNRKNAYFMSTSPLLVLSTPKTHKSFSDLQDSLT